MVKKRKKENILAVRICKTVVVEYFLEKYRLNNEKHVQKKKKREKQANIARR